MRPPVVQWAAWNHKHSWKGISLQIEHRLYRAYSYNGSAFKDKRLLRALVEHYYCFMFYRHTFRFTAEYRVLYSVYWIHPMIPISNNNK